MDEEYITFAHNSSQLKKLPFNLEDIRSDIVPVEKGPLGPMSHLHTTIKSTNSKFQNELDMETNSDYSLQSKYDTLIKEYIQFLEKQGI